MATSLRWVLPQQLAVGPFPTAADLINLKRVKIQAVVTLCTEVEGQLPAIAAEFCCVRQPLPDSHSLKILTPEQISAAVDLVQRFQQQGLPTYVHCLAGVERSPLICAAYLCRHHQLPVWEALNHLRSINSRTRLTLSQLKTLQQWAKPFVE
ncbi:MAG: dual specificity protein phosphatase family protein [Leptolyngbyaceae cyanobacterium SM1_1_3]|nr:dual specificity protein phosphatase family protein [Leptolyngbyaceae cyanobacterium SM1_1_3]NJN02356.1 dual specificity protein phosphatase family protein [Leptolyngbyaceae cyanobacterium RM1_1_2]NJO10391.1 dual specificity protein phosphatase family protein [Leptolyngbyaceae cyanobacterium SL_1_1]